MSYGQLDEEERKVMQGEQWTESANVSNDGEPLLPLIPQLLILSYSSS
jgi:hypothetical protein